MVHLPLTTIHNNLEFPWDDTCCHIKFFPFIKMIFDIGVWAMNTSFELTVWLGLNGFTIKDLKALKRT